MPSSLLTCVRLVARSASKRRTFPSPRSPRSSRPGQWLILSALQDSLSLRSSPHCHLCCPSAIGQAQRLWGPWSRGRGAHYRELQGALITSARALTCVGLLSALVGIICLPGPVGTLLSSESQPSVEASVAVAFTLFGCSLPLNLGNSVSIALNRTHISLIVQTVAARSRWALSACRAPCMHRPRPSSRRASLRSVWWARPACCWPGARCIPLFGLVLRVLAQ